MGADLPDQVRLGSETAKNGFRNEAAVVERFGQWKTNATTQQWLIIMGYDLKKIEWVHAAKVPGHHKADVQVQVTIQLSDVIGVENLQVKLVSQRAGFNQVDKRWLKSYAALWEIPADVYKLLQHFTGELPPTTTGRDSRRMFAHEFTEQEQHRLLEFFRDQRTLIISDILKGRGKFSAEWFLVILKEDAKERWALKPINYVLNFYGNGEVAITPRGSFQIGRITIQRKGGDAGRNTANMLQFKINPALLVG